MVRTFCTNKSSSDGLRVGGTLVVGPCGFVTVTRAVADSVPPGPVAVKRYVVDCVGRTCCVPDTATLPNVSMVTEVAPVVDHSSVDACPRSIDGGFADNRAVGLAGASCG